MILRHFGIESEFSYRVYHQYFLCFAVPKARGKLPQEPFQALVGPGTDPLL
jgi:hypothetical protein